jgi:hypothetical protein
MSGGAGNCVAVAAAVASPGASGVPAGKAGDVSAPCVAEGGWCDAADDGSEVVAPGDGVSASGESVEAGAKEGGGVAVVGAGDEAAVVDAGAAVAVVGSGDSSSPGVPVGTGVVGVAGVSVAGPDVGVRVGTVWRMPS